MIHQSWDFLRFSYSVSATKINWMSHTSHNSSLVIPLPEAPSTRLHHVLNDGVKIMFWIMFWFMFTFIWAVGQAPAVESLKTQNSNMYLELDIYIQNTRDDTSHFFQDSWLWLWLLAFIRWLWLESWLLESWLHITKGYVPYSTYICPFEAQKYIF